MSAAQAEALVDAAERSDTTLQSLVEAYAFGSPSTPAQREALAASVVGRSVEWTLPVQDVGYAEGRFVISTAAIATHDRSAAVPVLKVVAFVLPRDDKDQATLMRLRTDERVRVRGIVQEVRDGRTVAIVPALLVPTSGGPEIST